MGGPFADAATRSRRDAAAMTRRPPHCRAHVVIAGGGVAALEAMIALHDLAADHVRVTLVTPQPHFVYRPLSVAEPFSLGHAARHSLAELTREFDADLVRASVAAVDVPRRRVVLDDGS